MIDRVKILLILCCLATPLAVSSQTQEKKDYTRFNHKSHLGLVKIPGTGRVRELKCDQCHERSVKRGSIIPNTSRNERLELSFPGHRACVECHIVQFTSRPLETCGICHSGEQALSSRPPQRDFPLRYDYNVFFDTKQHEAHIGYKFADGRNLDCAGCHQPTQRQVARLIPSHPECYSCHAPSSSDARAKLKAGCIVCHTQAVAKVDPREYKSLAYGARFSHRTHVGYVGNDCTVCHTISGAYNQPSPKPATIRVKQHLNERERSGRGCFSCHDGGTHFGRPVFSGEYGPAGKGACAKCHGDELRVFPTPG